MKLKSFSLIFSFVTLLSSLIYILGNPLTKIQENTHRYLEALGYDTYVTLYFKVDCNYSEGFKNAYRNGISFIINRENSDKFKSEDAFIAHKNFGIEIHFNRTITNLRSFFSSHLDKNMEYLISIDLSNFDTSSVTYMDSMFYKCSSLVSIDLSKFNTSLVKDMSTMFYGCISLKYINLTNFDTSSVTHMGSMFFNCSSLESLDLSNFNTSSVTYMGTMFYACSSVKTKDLTKF